MSLGQNIKNLRSKKKLTQEELAKASGLTKLQISRLERNMHEARQETLIKLASTFNCSIDSLVDLNTIDTNDIKITKLLNKISVINEKDKDAIINVIDSMLIKINIERWVEK